MTRARARATLCCCPPESWAGYGVDAGRLDAVFGEDRVEVVEAAIGQIGVHLRRPDFEGFETRLTSSGNLLWQCGLHGGCAVEAK
ncbi:MAG: hypothetical protein V3T71_00830 [Dehalococcoidia bacterium]